MLSRIKFEIAPLVNEILDQLPAEVWTSTSTTFMDPAIAGGQFVREVEHRLLEAGHSKKNVAGRVFGCEQYEHQVQYAVNKHKLTGKYSVTNFLEQDFKDMKFDVIVGNPPYQDGTKDGGQNKIYNVICKKSLSLLADDGIMAFVTPTSVLKKSKRFSLIDQPGLKSVNFATDEYFDVGINICSWIIDKTYKSDQVTVINSDRSTDVQKSSDPIYDYTAVDKDFTVLYNTLKQTTDAPDKRMFRENNFGDAISKEKSKSFTHVLYSVNKESDKEIFGYSKRIPFFHKKKKIVIPMTKTLSDDSILVDTDDFYVAYLCTEIKSQKEIDNIKSFILSDYFKRHSEKWRNLDGYGFNYALKYLPPFDKTKPWTNEEVKEFLEGFLSA
jgi:tRNA G10  N-methylase Trm11